MPVLYGNAAEDAFNAAFHELYQQHIRDLLYRSYPLFNTKDDTAKDARIFYGDKLEMETVNSELP